MQACEPAIRTLVIGHRQMTVASNETAQVPASIVGPVLGCLCKLSGADEVVVESQVGPTLAALLCAGDMLPSAPRQEPVIAAGD
jgi:hypothetical protein